MEYQKVSMFEGLLLNLSDRDLYLKIKDNTQENSAFSVHKILIEGGTPQGNDHYKLKANDFLMVTLFGFPRKRGFFDLN